jgi:Na+/proline symporter
MKKILNIVEIILLAVGVLSCVLWLVGVADVDLMLYVAYAFLIIAFLVAIVMTVMNMGKSRNKNKIGLIVGGFCVVLAVVFYVAFASSQPVTDAGGEIYDGVLELKGTDTMLYLAYTTLIGALVCTLLGEIRNAIK